MEAFDEENRRVGSLCDQLLQSEKEKEEELYGHCRKKTRRTIIRELLAAATTNEVSGVRCYRFAFYGEHNIWPSPHHVFSVPVVPFENNLSPLRWWKPSKRD